MLGSVWSGSRCFQGLGMAFHGVTDCMYVLARVGSTITSSSFPASPLSLTPVSIVCFSHSSHWPCQSRDHAPIWRVDSFQSTRFGTRHDRSFAFQYFPKGQYWSILDQYKCPSRPQLVLYPRLHLVSTSVIIQPGICATLVLSNLINSLFLPLNPITLCRPSPTLYIIISHSA